MERTEAAPRQSHDGYQLLVPGDEATAVKEVRIFMIKVVVKLQSFKRRLSEDFTILLGPSPDQCPYSIVS